MCAGAVEAHGPEEFPSPSMELDTFKGPPMLPPAVGFAQDTISLAKLGAGM